MLRLAEGQRPEKAALHLQACSYHAGEQWLLLKLHQAPGPACTILSYGLKALSFKLLEKRVADLPCGLGKREHPLSQGRAQTVIEPQSHTNKMRCLLPWVRGRKHWNYLRMRPAILIHPHYQPTTEKEASQLPREGREGGDFHPSQWPKAEHGALRKTLQVPSPTVSTRRWQATTRRMRGQCDTLKINTAVTKSKHSPPPEQTA